MLGGSRAFQGQLEHLTVLFWSSPWPVSHKYQRTQTSVWLLGADWFLINDGSTGTGPEVWDLRGLQLDAMTGFSQSCVNVVLRYTQTADVVVEVTGWVVKLLGKTALQWKKSRNLQNYCFLTGILLMFHDRFIHIVLKMSRKDPLLCEKCILCSWITIWQCWLLRVFFQKCTFSS